MFWAALTFLKSNIKWLAILVGIIVFAYMAWSYTNMVKNYSKAEQAISQLEDNVKNLESSIQIIQDIQAETNKILEDRERANEELNRVILSLTQDLPDDSSDLAPESLRETLRRLKEQTK